MTLAEAIGRTIRERRRELCMSQLQLAMLAEASSNALYKIERGEANPGLALLEKIGSVLELELKLEPKKKE